MKDYNKEIKINKFLLLFTNVLCLTLVVGFFIGCLTGDNSLSNIKDITVSVILYILLADGFKFKIEMLELKRDLDK